MWLRTGRSAIRDDRICRHRYTKLVASRPVCACLSAVQCACRWCRTMTAVCCVLYRNWERARQGWAVANWVYGIRGSRSGTVDDSSFL